MPVSQVRLLASEDSVGEIYKFREDEASVELLDEDAFSGVDIAFFATSADLSERLVPAALEQGALVIDNSGYYAQRPEARLVVPGVNSSVLTRETRLVANPNCTTTQLAPVLDIINKAAGLKRVVVSSYQSVSGAGKAALDELWGQTISVFNQQALEVEALPHQIAFNCIPQIDLMAEDGYTREESRLIAESRLILKMPELRMTATAVRVPVFYSHAQSVNIETERELLPEKLSALLEAASGIQVYPSCSEYPMQADVSGSGDIHVGRIRQDKSLPHGLDMWVVADNVRRGVALNAVQIAQTCFDLFQ